VLTLAELLALSLWFTGTAVLPQLARMWAVPLSALAWVTIAVQLGFVAGALVAALLNLADVLSAPKLAALSAAMAAAANAGFALSASRGTAPGVASLPFLFRFLTGFFLAGVYPPGMKILAGWFQQGRGLGLGILIGGLTIGSALPHLAQATGERMFIGLGWQGVVLASSGLATAGAVMIWLGVREGPFAAKQPRFRLSQMGEALGNRRLRLANFGYLGHMWELYSMWGWIAVILASSAAGGVSVQEIELGAFATIAIGAIGCVWAGRVSDHLGPAGAGDLAQERLRQRAGVTVVAMAVSGACCIAAAAVFEHFYLLLVVAMVWGIAVIADSAQFSAVVSEVSDASYVGTALTTQTAMGFLLTTVSIRATAWMGSHYGWRWAAASMAMGPVFGIAAMMRLRIEPSGH